MRFPDVDRISTKRVNNLEVMLKHVRVLVIFGVDVLSYRRGEGKVCRLAKGERKDVAELV